MVSPSICGGMLTDRHSMVAFTWTITTLLTLLAFLTAVVLMIQIHIQYGRMERYYQSDDWYQNYNNNNNNNDGEEEGEEEGGGSGDADRQQAALLLLATMSARSITFVAVYTMMLATGLSLYGSTAIVGFTSLRGVYITPCFSSGPDNMRVGIFGGAVVIFANLLLVIAVVLGEVRVEDYKNNQDQGDEMEPYQVERISTVLAVACMFLSALYTIFAILLFLCYASDEMTSEGVETHDSGGPSHSKTPLVTVSTADQRHIDSPGFITMENSSQSDTHSTGFITMEQNSSQDQQRLE